jgi:hypothetical protein
MATNQTVIKTFFQWKINVESAPRMEPTIMKVAIHRAGYETRFLPPPRCNHKMLPILDKAVIESVVGEAIASDIDDIVAIISPGTPTSEHCFDLPRAQDNSQAFLTCRTPAHCG